MRARVVLLALACGCEATPDAPDVEGVRVVAIRAVQLAGGGAAAPEVLPEVQLWGRDTSAAGALPPAWGALRVVLEGAPNPSTFAPPPAFDGPLGPGSACLPTAGLRLLDPSGAEVMSSVCFDPGGPDGRASLLIVPGAGQLVRRTGSAPFACGVFSSAAGAGESFPSGATFALRFGSGLLGTDGTFLRVPLPSAGAGWAWLHGSFSFDVAGFGLLGATWQDQSTGTSFVLAKDAPGFLPLRPVIEAGGGGDACADGPDAGRPCRLPPDQSPVLLFFSRELNMASSSGAALRLTRANGTPVGFTVESAPLLVVDAGAGVSALAPPSVLAVHPLAAWETDTDYVLTIPAGALTADDGEVFPADRRIPFTVARRTPGPPVVDPAKDATFVPYDSPSVRLSYDAPVATVGGAPLGTFSLAQIFADADPLPVPVAASIAPDTNGQVVVITPLQLPLFPGSQYQVSARGISTGVVAARPGEPQPDLRGSNFTTAPFGVAALLALQGASASPLVRAGVSPLALYDGSLAIRFRGLAGPVNSTTVSVSPFDAILLAPVSLPMALDGEIWSVRLAPTAALRFSQRYVLSFSDRLVDTRNGYPLTGFGCAPPCGDAEVFTTAVFEPAVSAQKAADGTFSGFTLKFPVPIDSSTLDLAADFFIEETGPDGAGKPALHPSCALSADGASVLCALPGGTLLQPGATYRYGGTFAGGGVRARSTLVVQTPAGPATVAVSPDASSAFTGTTLCNGAACTFRAPCR